jgi:hypothetical protein
MTATTDSIATAVHPQTQPRKKQRDWVAARWAFVPVAILVSLGAGLLFMARLAVNDPNFALEPDYYQQALKWDEQRARHQHDLRLGWSVSWDFQGNPEPSVPLDETRERPIALALTDAQGLPLSGAAVALHAFHKAYAVDLVNLTLQETAPGKYAGRMRFPRSGIWQLRLQVQARGETFNLTDDAELSPARGRVLGDHTTRAPGSSSPGLDARGASAP